MNQKKQYTLGALLFDSFELLDLYGPLEMFSGLPDVKIVTVAEQPGLVTATGGTRVNADIGINDNGRFDFLLVPGGWGTRPAVNNEALLAWIRAQAQVAQIVMSVCTGSALLAKAGVLDGKRATSNKRALGWVKAQGLNTHWVDKARWVQEGNIFTSSGVSAGMDMALAMIAYHWGKAEAEQIAVRVEYEWQQNADHDVFADYYLETTV
jgi:transcriptional regulator GlxA family with amidase domain